MKKILFILTLVLIPMLFSAWPAAVSHAAGMRQIKRLYNSKDYDRARKELEGELPHLSGRDLSDAELMLASLSTEAEEASRIYSRVMSSGSSREALRARLELAKIHYSTGDYRRVTELLSDLPKGGRSSDVLECRYFCGLAYKETGESDRARREFESIDRGEFLYWSYMALAEIDIRYGRIDDAIARYEMIAGSHSNPVAGFKLGECYEISGNRDKAIETYRNIARLFPESLEAPRAREKLQMLEAGRRSGRERNTASGGGEGEKAGTVETEGREEAQQYYTLQFGAFSEKENAEAFAEELGKFIDGLRIEKADSRGKTWYRVRVGRYATREKAEEESLGLMEKSGYSSKVLPLE